MPEHRYGGRKKRALALALIVPATTVAAIFTAGLATGNTTTSPVAQPTDVPGLPSPLNPGTGNGTGQGSPTATRTPGTGTGSPTRTTAGPAVPGATTGTGTATAGATCVTAGGTASPTRTGGGVVPGTTSPTSPTATRTSPTGTGTGQTATGGPTATGTGTAMVPGAAQQPTSPPTGGATGTRTGPAVPPGQTAGTGTATASPTATAPSPTRTTTPAPTGTAAQTTLTVGTAGGKSNVIVDHNGCAVYLNTNDTPTSTACDTACERTWIPVTAPATVRGGLDQAKVGTFQRPSGVSQVTYNGHQLYRFVGDRAPGEAKGQGVDNIWWLVGQNGEPVK